MVSKTQRTNGAAWLAPINFKMTLKTIVDSAKPITKFKTPKINCDVIIYIIYAGLIKKVAVKIIENLLLLINKNMKIQATTIETEGLLISESVIFSLAFLIPFLISGPQLLTGTLVNCLLISGIKFVDKKNHLFLAALPSVAAVLNGLVFGKFTIFLVYFLPFIWLSNFVLIRSIIYLKEKLSLSFSITLSIILKTVILFVTALVYFKFNFVPEIFLTAMGAFQLATGIMGGLMFLGINKILYDRFR